MPTRMQSSWGDDAIKLDRQSGVYADPELMCTIDHVGKFYHVLGPHICQASSQWTPVILQADVSSAGKAFAAKHAEAVVFITFTSAIVAQNIADTIKVLAKVIAVSGATEELAQGNYNEYMVYGAKERALALFFFGDYTSIGLSLSTLHIPKWTKGAIAEEMKIEGIGATVVGTPEHVADELGRWICEADVDGFNPTYALMPRIFEEVIEPFLLVLRNRRLFWEGYEVLRGTYHESIWAKKGAARPPSDHPAAKYQWKKAK